MARTSSRLVAFASIPLFAIVACGGDGGSADPGSSGDTSSSSSTGGGESSSSSGDNGSSSSSGSSTSSSSSTSSGSSTSSASSSGQQPATCSDGIKNGNEADVDCGLACDNKCLTGKACGGKPDCVDGVCTEGLCAAPTDEDNVKNGTETDVDCGGPAARKCSNPDRCLIATDCVSDGCGEDGRCVASHNDGVKNLTETDIDCGGADAALRCAPGRACGVAADCVDEGNCVGAVCQLPGFNDGYKNLGETDVDCGGPSPVRCGNDKRCDAQSDCSSQTYCNTSLPQPKCQIPTPGDTITNGTETDIDCGGSSSRPTCQNGRGCNTGADCNSGVCTAGATSDPAASPAPAVGTKRCKAPATNDGVKNGTETDVDCGGAGNPTCSVDKSCLVHGDCASDGCHATRKVCVAHRSCAMTYGGDTCGGQANTESGGESCCATIEVQRPTKTRVALGKFKTTAGRMRQMIERTNGNVRGFIEGLALPATRWNATWTPWLTQNLDDVARRLGPNAQPDESGFGTITGARGCQVSVSGGRPYWFNVGDGSGPGLVGPGEGGKYSHDILDQKVMTCLMPAMAAAFCIWDGGELADPDDLDYAWNGTANPANGAVTNGRKYPWGDDPAPPTARGGTDAACVGSNCNSRIVHMWNYNYPNYASPDSSSIIPAPGRRPAGAGPFGHMDLAGAGFEYAKKTPAAGASTLHNFNSGSFEGHVPGVNGTYGGPEINRRYWAYTAGRCSYPVP